MSMSSDSTISVVYQFTAVSLPDESTENVILVRGHETHEEDMDAAINFLVSRPPERPVAQLRRSARIASLLNKH